MYIRLINNYIYTQNTIHKKLKTYSDLYLSIYLEEQNKQLKINEISTLKCLATLGYILQHYYRN